MLKKKYLTAAIITAIAALTASTTVLAAAPGFYIEGQAGYSDTHYNLGDFPGIGSASFDSTGVGYRPSVGYAFTENWAVEAGYTRWANSKVTNILLIPGSTVATANPGLTLFNGAVKQNAWDVVVKGMYPFENGFGIFGKGGLSYVLRQNQGGLVFYSGTHKWRPTGTGGVSYDFNQNISIDVSFTRVFNGAGVENADLTAVGLAYYFG